MLILILRTAYVVVLYFMGLKPFKVRALFDPQNDRRLSDRITGHPVSPVILISSPCPIFYSLISFGFSMECYITGECFQFMTLFSIFTFSSFEFRNISL